MQPVRTGGETRNPNQNAPDSNATHEKKETGENPVFSPAFWQGQKDLNPRHAVLEWMWKHESENGGGPVLPGSSRKLERGRCCSGATDSLGPNS